MAKHIYEIYATGTVIPQIRGINAMGVVSHSL